MTHLFSDGNWLTKPDETCYTFYNGHFRSTNIADFIPIIEDPKPFIVSESGGKWFIKFGNHIPMVYDTEFNSMKNLVEYMAKEIECRS